MLTLTNLFIVLGLRQAIRQAEDSKTREVQQAESSEQLSPQLLEERREEPAVKR